MRNFWELRVCLLAGCSFMYPDLEVVQLNAINSTQCEVQKISNLAAEPTLLRTALCSSQIADRLTFEIATFRRGDGLSAGPTNAEYGMT